MMAFIRNTPAHYSDYSFIVARKCNGDWWYWGSYHDRASAADAAWDIGGEVFTMEEVVPS